MPEEESTTEYVAYINDRIEKAMRQFEAGLFYTSEESRADMEKRKAAWLAARNSDSDSER